MALTRFKVNFTGELNLPSTVKVINNYAFISCTGFTGKLVIPDGVTTIGNQVFQGCRGFTGDLSLPSSVTSIGDYTFYGCTGLTGDLVFPGNVKQMGSLCFRNCSGLRTATFQASEISFSVSGLNSGIFTGCTGLEYIDMHSATITGVNVPLRDSGSSPFYNMQVHTVIYLPAGIVKDVISSESANMNYVQLDQSGTDQCQWFYVSDGFDYYLPYGFTAGRASFDRYNFSTSTASTVYLPFPFRLMEGMKGYALAFVNEHNPDNVDDNMLTFKQKDADYEYAANTPYVINSTKQGIIIQDFTIDVPATPVDIYHNGNTNAVDHSTSPTVTDKYGTTWGFYGEKISNDDVTNVNHWSTYNLSGNSWHKIINDSQGFIAPMCGFIATTNAGVCTAKDVFKIQFVDINGNTRISTINNEEIIDNSVETRLYTIGGQYAGKDFNALPKGLYIVNGKKVMK